LVGIILSSDVVFFQLKIILLHSYLHNNLLFVLVIKHCFCDNRIFIFVSLCPVEHLQLDQCQRNLWPGGTIGGRSPP